MRFPNRTVFALVALTTAVSLCQFAFAQYTVSTIAGGGPNNLPALQSSIGNAPSIALDGTGNVYIADAYASQVLKLSTTGTVTVAAGNGTQGYSGDGGPATSAALGVFGPEGIAVDGSGNLYIADTYNSVIRVVNTGTTSVTIAGTAIQPGTIQTIAGNFAAGAGYSGDNGPATSAQLNDPFGVAVDIHGNIFIADTDNFVIREVSNSGGTIQTVAGNFAAGAGFSGDNGPATSAQLDNPEGVYVDANGNIFVADTLNAVIRAVNPGAGSVTIAGVTIAAGNIQTVAGSHYNSQSGTACQFTGDNGPALSAFLCLPVGIFVDGFENIYIADTANYAIREVGAAGTITTVAGTLGQFGYTPASGPATSALMNYPAGVAVDGSGNLFVADSDNYVVREVTSGNIQTIAGNNTLAYSGDGAPATSAELNFPGAVFVDAAGNVFIVDSNSSVIRVVNTGAQAITLAGVTIQPGAIQTVAGNGTTCAVPAPGGCGDGGPSTSAQLNFPAGIFVDASENIFIADTGLPSAENSAIRVVNTGTQAVTVAGVTIQPGSIATVVGTLGTAGFSGDGSAPTSAELSNPQGVVLDGAGNLYIADTGNSAVRVVNTGTTALTIAGVTIQPGAIATVAGTPPTACADTSTGCGDNGAATAAFLSFPSGISVDGTGNIYIADTFSSAVRVVNPGTQPVTIAGTTIPPGDILTVAGTLGRDGYSGDNGAPASALLNTPWGVWVDTLGNIFIADTDNSAIRQVVAVDSTIQTIAGTGAAGFSGDGSSAASAQLSGPETVALGAGNIFIADSQNSRIRQLVSTVSVSVVPASTIVPAGGTQQFLAVVTGATNTSVTWQVNGVTGGNATVGTIAADGLYTTPATIPGSAIIVTAISDANGTTPGSASVTIAASGAPAVSITTNPPGVTVVYTSTTQQFTANLTGVTSSGVNWEVNGTAGGNSTVGTIDASGFYTAPTAVPSPALVIISAISQADSTVSASYPITIVTAPSASQPPPQTISAGGTANFSLSLNANTGIPHQPITLSCLQRSLPTGATCSFTPPTITPSSSAVAFNLKVSVPSSAASLAEKPSTSLVAKVFASFSPVGFSPVGFITLAGFLLLVGYGRNSKRRRFSLCFSLAICCLFCAALVACGGSSHSTTNPVTYNIQVQGTTAAQPNPVPITVVQLTVQ